MSNRLKNFITLTSNQNPATFTGLGLTSIGNVRITNVQVPHSYSQVKTSANDQIRITMVGQSTVTVTIPNANFQNRQNLADLISCEFTRAKTGWTEDVVSGYITPEQRFVIKSIKFAIDDPDEEYPLDGDEEIIIENTLTAERNIAYRLMGYDTTVATIQQQSHKSTYKDTLYNRQFIYIRSLNLSTGMTNNTRLEVDGTSTPPGAADRCVFVLPVDQTATQGRLISSFVADVQTFYSNSPAPPYKDLDTIDITLTDENGDALDFEFNPNGDPKYNRWTLILRADPVEPIVP